MEFWAPIKDFENYSVSSTGRVKTSTYRGQKMDSEISVHPNNGGYYRVHLWRQGKMFTKSIHRIVLETFACDGCYGRQAAHLDGNKSNNKIDNLRWVTAKENNRHQEVHGTRLRGSKVWTAKLTALDIKNIRDLKNSGLSNKEIHLKFPDISKQAIIRATTNSKFRTWKHL